MKSALVLAALALAAGASLRPAYAAHAGAPYTNVDHKNDAGNDTGDSKVDDLNAAQLNNNYYQSHPAPPPGAVVVPPR
jgi:hypothetical protein